MSSGFNRIDRLQVFLGTIASVFSTIVYVLFSGAVLLFGQKGYWEGLDFFTGPLLTTPVLFLMLCIWFSYFDLSTSFVRLLPMILCALGLVFVAFLPPFLKWVDYSSPIYSEEALSITYRVCLFSAFLFLLFRFGTLSGSRCGPEFLLTLSSLQFVFLIAALFSEFSLLVMLLFTPYLVAEFVLVDFSGLFILYVIYLLQLIIFCVLLSLMSFLSLMFPLACKLRKLGYQEIPVNMLWLLFRRSRVSILNLVPASEVGYDLAKCVQLNCEEGQKE